VAVSLAELLAPRPYIGRVVEAVNFPTLTTTFHLKAFWEGGAVIFICVEHPIT